MLKTLQRVKIRPAVISGLLFALAFPPFNLFFLVFVALVPWLLSLAKPETKGFRSGLIFGLIFWMTQVLWIAQFAAKWTQSIALGLIPFFAIIGVAIWYFGFLGWAIQRAWIMKRPLLIPLIWVSVEFIRSSAFALAFPWGLIALPLGNFPPLIQAASMGSIYLVSGWVVLFNVIACLFLYEDNPRKVFQPLILFIMLLMFSVAKFNQPVPGQLRLLVAAQHGVDMAYGDEATRQIKLSIACRPLYLQAKSSGADLVVFPEGTAVGGGLPPEHPFGELSTLPVVFGGFREQAKGHYQSSFVNFPKWDVVDKTQLVIFGEYVPLREQLPFLKSFNLPAGDLIAGSEIRPLLAGNIKVGPVLCFESLFPHVSHTMREKDAQVLAVLEIDDWYFGTSAPENLQLNSVFRAVENGLPLVRAASMGRSMVIDARGRTVAAVEQGRTGLARARVNVPDQPDSIAGQEIAPWIALAGTVFGLVFVRKKVTPSS